MDTQSVEQILKNSMGLNISSIGKTALHNAINRRCQALCLNNEEDYYLLLKESTSEINELIEEVTVNETWFFRYQKPFSAMVDFAHAITENNPLKKVNILSLPCSSGEEPYSITISLLESGWSKYSFSVDAVDISANAIEQAAKAVYGSNSFRGCDEYYKKKYFRNLAKDYILQEDVKRLVNFQKGNLINFTPTPSHKNYDIIFCRNLLIYLDKTAQTNAVITLDHLLDKNGILFIGHAESGIFEDSSFVPSQYPKTFSLVKKQPGQPVYNINSKIRPNPAREVKTSGPNRPPELLESIKFKVDELIEARMLLDEKKYGEAIELCEIHIKRKGPSSDGFFWLGTIFYAKGDKQKAIDMLKKAIYLNPQNIHAMELLSTTYRDINDTESLFNLKNRIKRVKTRLGRKI